MAVADIRISGLPAGIALTGTELVPVVQSGATVRSTVAAFASYASALPGMSTVVATVALLRNVSKLGNGFTFVTSVGAYYYDPTDTISSDNGGSIIVASDGGRWKLVSSAPYAATQFGVVFDNATDNQTAFTYLFATTRDVTLLDGAARVGTGNLTLNAKQSMSGQGRELTFLRTTHASNPVISSTAQFNSYIDLSVDRSGGVAGTGIQQTGVNNATPLEGFKLLRANVNGHATGVVLKDFVLASIEESYLQSCATGLSTDKTGANYCTMLAMKHVWVRGNTSVGAQINNVINGLYEQVAFEGSGVHTPTGLNISGGLSHTLVECWWEDVQTAAAFSNCGSVALYGGYLNGLALSSLGFYAIGCTVIFDGSWGVQNLAVPFATADAGATIIVRSPDLASYSFTAVNGGKIIWDLPMVRNRSVLTYSASMTPDASVSDLFTITATNGTAFTINAPTNGPSSGQSRRITIRVRNTSGGALGAATWNAVYKMSAWTNPANGFSRAIDFDWDGTNWVQASQTGVDVPN